MKLIVKAIFILVMYSTAVYIMIAVGNSFVGAIQ